MNAASPMPLRPALGLLLLLGACGPPEDEAAMLLWAAQPETYYLQNDGGPTLFFEVPLVNRTDSVQAFYLFAYAADNVSQPPARAVYPPRALASMPSDRRFAVGSPAAGLLLTLPPGDTVRFRGALPMPTTWPDGRTISSRAFLELSVYAYAAEGRAAFAQTWPLAGPYVR